MMTGAWHPHWKKNRGKEEAATRAALFGLAVSRGKRGAMQDETSNTFTPLPFEKLNEADVREEVIAPLLRRLRYKTGSESNIIREQLLRYPRLSLGRKDPKKDPELRGKADYILEVGGCRRWVIEAKAPDVAIGIDEVEQAWTYANHPEIRAIYFGLCNGRRLSVFRTAYGPSADTLLSLSYEEFDGKFQLLTNLLSPESLVRDFPEVELDVHLPIAPGLRSLARITNGLIRYERSNLNLSILNELQVGIADGAVERDETGRLVAFIKSVVPSHSLQKFNERLGLNQFEMVSVDAALSIDQRAPTVFDYQNTIILPAGEEVFDLMTWRPVKIPMNITCDVSARATGACADRRFSGKFESFMRYREVSIDLALAGTIEVHLA
jgi:hypothetical protein